MMWFSVALWSVLSSLVVAYSSHAAHSEFPDYDRRAAAAIADYDWTGAADDTRPQQDSAQDRSSPLLLSGLGDEEEEASAAAEGDRRGKREGGHSLSIVNPLDVLRQRLMLEMARRRMKENQEQIRENALILKNLGKRDLTNRRRRSRVSNNDNFDV